MATCGPYKPTAGGCVPHTEVFWARKESDASPVLLYLQVTCVAGKAVKTLTTDKAGTTPAVGYTEADKIATVIKGERGASCEDPVFVSVCSAAPTANLKIEFSEQLMYSASANTSLMRIREYNEDTGLWSLRYENLDGTPFAGVLPSDLVANTAQVQIGQTSQLGCASGTTYEQRTTDKFDAETGMLASSSTVWVDPTGATLVVAPAGFALGACEMGKDSEYAVLCDVSTNPPTPYLRRIITDFSTAVPTESYQNFTLNGAVYAPVTPGVCDGYDLTEGCAEVFNTASGLLTPVRALQVTRFGQFVGTPILYSTTSNAVVTPTATDRVMNCGEMTYTESFLCDSASPIVSFWRTQYKLGSTVLLTQDLNAAKTAAYAPVGAVGICQGYTTEDEYACIAGATPNDDTIKIRIVRVYNGLNLVSETRTRMDTYAVVGNAVVLVPCTQTAGTIRQGSAVGVGVAATIVPAGKKSISLVVRSGSVTGTGSLQTGAVQYRAGESYTWSVDQEGELLEAMTFTGSTPTTSYTLTWTQRA